MNRPRTFVLVVLASPVLAACSSSEEPSAAPSASAAATVAPALPTFDPEPPLPLPLPPPLPSPPDGVVQPGQASLVATDQEGDGKAVVVQQVVAPGPGAFVAVRADEAGAPGKVLGSAFVPGGGGPAAVVVSLGAKLTRSTPLWVVLHEDTGRTGEFEFQAGDPPARSTAGPVSGRITYTVPG